ncbi:MAG TPA: S53 family peptidase [Streptosporangiaceae bacterium]|jgi:subtilase family serine protease
MNISRRFLALGAASVVGLSGAVASAVPSSAQPLKTSKSTAAIRLTADAPARLPHGAVRLGPLAAASKLHLDVVLKVGDQAALNAFLAGLSNRQSPFFHHFLRPGQFGPRFGPTLASVAAVRAALRQAGLRPGAVSSNRLSIPVSTTAAAAEHAFGISLSRYRLAGGRVAYANSAAPKFSAAAAPYVSGVLGLNTLYPDHSMLAKPKPALKAKIAQRGMTAGRPLSQPDVVGPKACAAAKTAGVNDDGFTANQFASYYLMAPLYGLGDLGSGVRVAVYEQEPNLTTDINQYKTCYKVTTSVTYKKVDGGSGTGAGEGEAALDIEDVLGLAPDVAIDVYQGKNASDADSFDIYNAIITADQDQVITTSWGSCEAYSDQTLVSEEQTVFEQANTQGETVFAAAGDTGSTGCLRSGGPDAGAVSAGNPAAQPFVEGVGGTTIGASAETVWNESSSGNGAGGGGLSGYWCMPTYQYQTAIPGLIGSDSATNSACPTSVTRHIRQEPDVSADADPFGGYVVRYKGGWTVIGGTSAAAPLWAAVAALIDASPFCAAYGSGDAGVLPQGMYGQTGVDHAYIYSGGADEPEVFGDITLGNNDYTPSGYFGGLFPATAGYDMASGLGVPLVTGIGAGGTSSEFFPGLAAMMCQAYATKLTRTKVTAISPKSGTKAGGTTVTVTGTGFMPIAGADMAVIGTKDVPANCTSTTKCTVVMPAHAIGTVDIRISAEDVTLSAITTADQYTYTA